MNQEKKTIPKGWELKKICDLLDYERPDNYIVKSVAYDKNNKTPVLTANKSFILGYTNEDFGIYKDIPVIIFDDFTTDSKFVDFPFKIKSSAIKILKQKNKEINLKFIFEKMKSINFPVGNHKRYYISQYQEMNIVVPKEKNEQDKIAEILFKVDVDIDRTEEIIKKIEKLKKGLMWEFFNKKLKTKVSFISCIDLCSFKKIKGLKKKEYQNKGEYPIFDQGQKYISGYTDDNNLVNNNYPVILFGDHTRVVKFINQPFAVGADGIKLFQSKKENDPKFLYYSLLNLDIPNTGYNRHFKWVKEAKILLPPLDEQKKFVKVLSGVDKKIEINKQFKNKLIQLKKGLMNDLLSGRIRV
ncbi:MAG: restriction endonuclease subunit S [Parcubacteria group bacterium]